MPEVRRQCRKYGVKLYVEDEAFLTDLFPLSLNQGKYNALFYQEDSALQEYLALKGEKKAVLAQGTYGQARRDIAWRFGKLLSYTDEGIRRMLESNTESSPTPTRASGGCWRATQRKSETSPWRQPGGFLCKGACPSGWNGWLSGGLVFPQGKAVPHSRAWSSGRARSRLVDAMGRGAWRRPAAFWFLGKMFWIFKRFLQFVPCNFPPILLHF